MGKRNLYLNNTPVDEAVQLYKAALKELVKPEEELVPVAESLGRITAKAVYARYCSPLYNAAAMDGIAVVAGQTRGASEREPLLLVPDQNFAVVDTGDPIRLPWDAVIMAEDLLEMPDGCVQIMASASPWQHVRPIGEDIAAGEMLIPSRHEIRPVDIGVLLSGGIVEIAVYRQPSVAIFPTGTEIIEPGVEPKEGDIIESNSRMFEAMVTEYGGRPSRFAPIADDYEQIKTAIKDAAETFDMVIVNAGSSAGTEDFTVHILRELGEVFIHGVAIKPGKPVILAQVNHKPVIGLPGYPVSAYIDFENFAAPVIAMMTGKTLSRAVTKQAVLSKRLVSSLKHREYVRVKVGRVDGRLVASPLGRGAGAAMSLVRADGFCIIDQNSEGAEAGEQVLVELYRSMEEIDHTVVAIGSHDLILDVLADALPNHCPGTYLSSTHVGSMGGLMALKRGEAHLAPVHLLDEETGEYNVSYLKRLFDTPMVLIKGVERIQGIMVKKGNPSGIRSIRDLKKGRYINRQRGAGTRILLDYLLKKEGIETSDICGYELEAATHMAVAAAVSAGAADAGLGIESAARAMGLDFIPVGSEEYDFAAPVSSLSLLPVKSFLEVLKSDPFKASLEQLGGYRAVRTGEIIEIGSRG